MEQQIRFCTSADGTRIAYATYGERPGTPLLSVLGMNHELFWKLAEGRAFYEEAAMGRRLVGFDRRGYGGSQREIGDISLEALVRCTRIVFTNGPCSHFFR